MERVGNKVVTHSSFMPLLGESESTESGPEARTPEGQLRLARFTQILRRLKQEVDDAGSGDVMVTVEDREVSLAQSKLAADAFGGRALESGGQEVQFGTGLRGGDWFRWVWSLTDWLDRQNVHPMQRPTSTVANNLAGDIYVAIAADWGTGLYGAPETAATIRNMATSRRFDLAMHLGGVYYSGTEKEMRERFLDLWPSASGTINRALNGNHEMYSGGGGYFNLILPAFSQESGYFAIQNEHWLLVGLDTAYVEHDIDNVQVAWLNLIVKQANARKVVIFSHHQPFSRLGTQGPKLQQGLRHLLEAGRITAWYWGHEHDCVIYDRHPVWALFGRCLGNGGVPSARKPEVRSASMDPVRPAAHDCVWRRLEAAGSSPGCIVLDGPNRSFQTRKDQERFAPHGFMTLEFKGNELVERVFLSDGTDLYSNSIR